MLSQQKLRVARKKSFLRLGNSKVSRYENKLQEQIKTFLVYVEIAKAFDIKVT